MFPKTFRTSGNMGTSDVIGVAAGFQFDIWIVRILLYLFRVFLNEYENNDTTDIPEIDLNICVAVQPYQFEPLDRDSSSGTGSDSASAESDEECSRPSVKSSKQIIVNTH